MITAGSTAQQHLPGAERHADRPLKSLFRATDRGAAPAERAIAFGHFRLLPARRLLLAGPSSARRRMKARMMISPTSAEPITKARRWAASNGRAVQPRGLRGPGERGTTGQLAKLAADLVGAVAGDRHFTVEAVATHHLDAALEP
jgi:hypothetical protein